ncbi:MAG: hypothetical protein AAF423_11775 [Pseudomonadota bacterium]
MASESQEILLLKALRSDNVFSMAEFLFLLRNFEMDKEQERLGSYLEAHNVQMKELIDNSEKRLLLGLDIQRLKRGTFSPTQIMKAKANLTLPRPGLDQADIQRLTVLLFSPETGRRVLGQLESAGFITRESTPYQNKIIQSNGTVEREFARYLEELHESFRKAVV